MGPSNGKWEFKTFFPFQKQLTILMSQPLWAGAAVKQAAELGRSVPTPILPAHLKR